MHDFLFIYYDFFSSYDFSFAICDECFDLFLQAILEKIVIVQQLHIEVLLLFLK